MLTILLTLVTSSAAYTTYSPLHIGNHRSFMPVITADFALGKAQKVGGTYQFEIKFDDVLKLSDTVYQGHSSDIHRRVEEQHVYQRPHKHGNEHWNRRPGAAPTPLHNGNNKNSSTSDYIQEHNSWKQETIEDKTNENDRFNGSDDDRTISRQSDDVDNSQHITAYNYTRDNQATHSEDNHHGNLNNRTNSVQNQVNNTNSYVNQGPLKPYHDLINNKTDKNTNNITETHKNVVNTNNMTTNMNGVYVNKDNKYGSKTTQDNEVTSTHEARQDFEDDKWIWTNPTTLPSLDTTTDSPLKTTTLVPLDDRASFDGDACPSGKVKFQGTCIDID